MCRQVDQGKLWGDADVLEASQLPSPHREVLHQGLARLLKGRSRLDNAAISEAALIFMSRLLGSYRRFVRPGAGAGADVAIHPDFDEEGFVRDAPPSVQPFLRAMRSSQLFEVFISHQISLSPAGRLSSAFERAVDQRIRYQPLIPRPTSPGPHVTLALTSPGPHVTLALTSPGAVCDHWLAGKRRWASA